MSWLTEAVPGVSGYALLLSAALTLGWSLLVPALPGGGSDGSRSARPEPLVGAMQVVGARRPPAGSVRRLPAGPDIDRVVSDPRITEASGLAPSLLHAGVLWTHNDSGHPAQLFALGTDGRTVATLRLTGEPAVDWEAITCLRDRAGAPLIAVGDIGDNAGRRPDVRIAMVREPAALHDARVRPVRVLRLRYPQGPVDAETLLADPRSGRLYLVSKTLFGADLFAVPEPAWPGSSPSNPGAGSPSWTLQRVASVAFGLVTDGTFLADGRLLLRNYGHLAVFARLPSRSSGQLLPLAVLDLPREQQGEGLTADPKGRWLLIGSEGLRQPVLRVPVPLQGGTAERTATVPPATRGLQGGRSRPALPPAAMAGVVVVTGVVVAAVLVSAFSRAARRRGRRSG